MSQLPLWYEHQRTGLGRVFLRSARDRFTAIRRAPLIYQRVHGNTRQVNLRSFPYVLLFEVADHEVVIVACIRTARHILR